MFCLLVCSAIACKDLCHLTQAVSTVEKITILFASSDPF